MKKSNQKASPAKATQRTTKVAPARSHKLAGASSSLGDVEPMVVPVRARYAWMRGAPHTLVCVIPTGDHAGQHNAELRLGGFCIVVGKETLLNVSSNVAAMLVTCSPWTEAPSSVCSLQVPDDMSSKLSASVFDAALAQHNGAA